MKLNFKAASGVIKRNPILAVCLVLTAGLLLIIYSRSDLVSEQQDLLDQKSAEGGRYHVNLANASQLPEELAVVVEANKIVQGRAINPSDLARNLQYFYRLEAEAGVKYTDIKQVGGAPAKRTNSVYIPIAFTLNVQGGFPKIVTFMKNLEHGTHFYRLNVLSATGAGSELTLNLTIDLLGKL